MGAIKPEQLEGELQSIVHDLSRIRNRIMILEQTVDHQDIRADLQCCLIDKVTPLLQSLEGLLKLSQPEQKNQRR